MSLRSGVDDKSGGRLVLVYHNPLAGERRQIHLAVRPFAAEPSGPDADHAYLDPPGESGLIATFLNFARLWAPYYTHDWSLAISQVWRNENDHLTLLPGVPHVNAALGNATFDPASLSATQRTFIMYSHLGRYWRVRLGQVCADHAGYTVDVTATDGGFDLRDQDMVAYLSGPTCAICAADGIGFRALARVRSWWARQIEPLVVSGGQGEGGGGGGESPAMLAARQCGAANRVGDMLDVAYAWATDRLRFALQSWLTNASQINNIISTIAGWLPIRLPSSLLAGFAPAWIRDKIQGDIVFNPVAAVSGIVTLWEQQDYQQALKKMPPLTPGQTDGIRHAIYDALVAHNTLRPSECLDAIQDNINDYPNWIDDTQPNLLCYCLVILAEEWDTFAAEGANNPCGVIPGTDIAAGRTHVTCSATAPSDPAPGDIWCEVHEGRAGLAAKDWPFRAWYWNPCIYGGAWQPIWNPVLVDTVPPINGQSGLVPIDGTIWIDSSAYPDLVASVYAAAVGRWVSLRGPAGPAGPQGEQGPRGEQGEQGATGPPGTGLAGDCVEFPGGATICNDVTHVIHFNTGGGQLAMDDTGITLPGGGRLEMVV